MFNIFVFTCKHLIPRDIELTELKPIKSFYYSSSKKVLTPKRVSDGK